MTLKQLISKCDSVGQLERDESSSRLGKFPFWCELPKCPTNHFIIRSNCTWCELCLRHKAVLGSECHCCSQLLPSSVQRPCFDLGTQVQFNRLRKSRPLLGLVRTQISNYRTLNTYAHFHTQVTQSGFIPQSPVLSTTVTVLDGAGSALLWVDLHTASDRVE